MAALLTGAFPALDASGAIASRGCVSGAVDYLSEAILFLQSEHFKALEDSYTILINPVNGL